eukprot:scaffold30778_cov40-Attheya_sp.AAC.3
MARLCSCLCTRSCLCVFGAMTMTATACYRYATGNRVAGGNTTQRYRHFLDFDILWFPFFLLPSTFSPPPKPYIFSSLSIIESRKTQKNGVVPEEDSSSQTTNDGKRKQKRLASY